MPFQFREGKVFIHVLPHLEGRGNVEAEFGDYAEPTEPYNGSLELLAVPFSGEGNQITLACHQFYSRDGRGEIPMPVTRAMRSRGTGACHRNMRQRGHIMKCITFSMQPAGKLTITHACLYSHSVLLVIQAQNFVELLKRDDIAGGIGNVIKGVTGAERL